MHLHLHLRLRLLVTVTPPQALESNPRVAAGVHQAGDAFGNLVRNVSGLAQQAMGQPPQADPSAAAPPDPTDGSFHVPGSADSAGAPPTKPV